MCNNKKNKCVGCIELDLMVLCEDNKVIKEEIRKYFESEEVGGY